MRMHRFSINAGAPHQALANYFLAGAGSIDRAIASV